MMNRSWWTILGLSSVFVIFILYTRYVSGQYKEIRQNGDKTNGEITVFGGDIICTFKIDGSQRTKRMSKPHESMRDGEHYNVYYYKAIPDMYYIDFSEPIIDSALFSKTISSHVNLRGDYFLFTYQVNGKPYERYQENIQGLKESRTYSVFYKKGDPEIAYLVP